MNKKFEAFIIGVGSLLDISFSLDELNKKLNNQFCNNDEQALRSDWEAVGKDLHGAINEYEI